MQIDVLAVLATIELKVTYEMNLNHSDRAFHSPSALSIFLTLYLFYLRFVTAYAFLSSFDRLLSPLY